MDLRRFPTLVLFSLLLSVPLIASAEDATPYPFCTVCPAAVERPTPRSGQWFDMNRPGSAMSLENQHGYWSGVYYGYDESGDATWYFFGGVPERAQEGTGYWTLETELLEFRDGNCIDCAAKAPEMTGSRGTLELSAVQRNVIRYRIDGGDTYTMQPLVWGTDMRSLLPEFPETRLPFPAPIGSDAESMAAAWVVTERGEGRYSGGRVTVRDVYWLDPWESWASSWWSHLDPLPYNEEASPPLPGIRIQCGAVADWNSWAPAWMQVPQSLQDQLGDAPVCLFAADEGRNEFRWFVGQPGDIGDDYFFAVAADGKSVLEGTRLFYR